MTAAELNLDLRTLIDARLEAIDRILADARIAWSERRSIIGEVETQIFELLARRGPAPQREDVLAVLSSLDPPEAYIPDELRERLAAASTCCEGESICWRELPGESLRFLRRLTVPALGIVTLVVVNGAVLLIVAASEGVIPWLVTLSALAWLNCAGVRRARGWARMHRGNVVDEFRDSLATWLLSGRTMRAT